MKLKITGYDEIEIDVARHSVAIVDGTLQIFDELGRCILKHLFKSPEEVVIKN